LTAAACSTPQLPRQPNAGEPTLRVLSYNVNYGLADDDGAEPSTLRAIVEADADVIFLQETTPSWAAALRAHLAGAYPHMAFHDAGHGPAGLAVLSRLPVEEHDVLPAVTWFPAQRVVLQTPLGRVQALNVHLRPPFDDNGSIVSGYFSTPAVRVAEIDAFVGALDPALPTLLVGDFNEDDGDAVKRMTARGFVDAVPRFAPAAHTWRWQVSAIQVTGRLDHLFYDERWQALDVRVHDVGKSDHLPIVAVLAAAQRTTRR
jgi:endonuclease/exonuclease/phosphatase family metal-dependent hydrolase